MLESAYLSIAKQKLTGLVDDIFVSSRHIERQQLWAPAAKAVHTSSSQQDWDKIVSQLKSEHVAARGVALHAICLNTERSLEEIAGLLASLAADEDYRILHIVATELAQRRDRRCIEVFVKLLNAPTLQIRVAARHALRQATGQKFDYDATAQEPLRIAAQVKWSQWVQQNIATAPIKLPLEGNGELVLYNGKDLQGWRMVVGSNVLSQQAAETMWDMRNDVLALKAPTTGYLRTEQAFTNYILNLEYRWDKNARAADGGIHILQTGPDSSYPNCLEIQTHMGNAGDFYTIGGFKVEPGGKLNTGVRSRMADSSEKPPGQWNKIEVHVQNGNVKVKVNDVLQNEATKCPQVAGYIAIRIERATLELRNMNVVLLDQ